MTSVDLVYFQTEEQTYNQACDQVEDWVWYLARKRVMNQIGDRVVNHIIDHVWDELKESNQ